MIQPLQRNRPAAALPHTLPAVAKSPAKPTFLGNLFGNQVSRAIQRVSGTTVRPAGGATPSLTPAATPSPASQNSVTAPPVTPFAPPQGPSSPATDAALKMLASALEAAGVSASPLNMVAHDDVVGYPGGNYTNHLITLQAGSHTENFMADLVAMNPSVAVTEIKHLLAMG